MTKSSSSCEERKTSPTYDLKTIQELIAHGKVRVTTSAQKSAAGLGFGYDDIILVVRGMADDQFSHSMPAERAPCLWQDVCHVPIFEHLLYVKVQLAGCAVVVSFKEK